jgi:hypothetical protein
MYRVLIVVALAGCGSSKEDSGEAPKKKETPTGELPSLFTGKTVTLPGELTKAAFGAKKSEVLAAVGADGTYISSKTVPKVSFDLDFDKADKLTQIKVAAPSELEALVAAQWGPPSKTAKGVAFWFAPDTGLRAWLPDYAKGKALAISQYEPITKFLGPKGFTLAFAEGKALFGASLDELKTAWGAALCDFDREAPRIKDSLAKNAADSLYRLEPSMLRLRLCPKLPRTVEQFAPAGDVIRIGYDGKVLAFVMAIPTAGSMEVQQQVIEQLDAKFGTPVKLDTEKQHVRSYFDPAAKLRAVATLGEQSISLEVGPYLPVADIVGGDRPGLGFETPSMPGGTFAQIAKEDPAHFKQMGKLASLYFPPTEYGSTNTEVSLDFYDKHAETYGYHVVIHHTDREAAGDAVFALLKAKFGEPKKEAKSSDIDVYWSFAKAGRKISARRVSQQWQLYVTK